MDYNYLTYKMGCDFYTLYKVCIEYQDGSTTKTIKYSLENTREPHYYYEVRHDEDFEELQDYWARCHEVHASQVQDILAQKYPRVDLCVQGSWKCVESAKAKYLAIAETYKIPVDSIQNIWKEGHWWER